tara:strand:- start:1071 stop:1652 length:582 start_codon:yes stop_codon:yes gene_type:complete
MNLINIFPVSIGIFQNPEHDKIKNSLIKECKKIKSKTKRGGYNWDTDVYNTFGNFDLRQSKKFDKVNNWIFENVAKYAYRIGYNNLKIKCEESWFNFYNKNDYQEKHEHFPFDISAVYYLTCPKNSGDIKFYTHEPQGVRETFIKDNELSWKSFVVNPCGGRLLVFKSNLTHGVTQNKSSKTKISFAYNFKIL